MQDAHLRWMLMLLASLLLLIGFLFFYPPASQPTAASHPEFPSLLQSTGSYDTLSSWLGTIFGLLLIGVIALTIIIGLFRHNRRGGLTVWISRGFVVYGLVWVLIKAADGVYMTGQSPIYFGGFPLPTALLVYGIGAFPLVMLPLYYHYFERDIFSEQEQARFDALKEERKEASGGPA